MYIIKHSRDRCNFREGDSFASFHARSNYFINTQKPIIASTNSSRPGFVVASIDVASFQLGQLFIGAVVPPFTRRLHIPRGSKWRGYSSNLLSNPISNVTWSKSGELIIPPERTKSRLKSNIFLQFNKCRVCVKTNLISVKSFFVASRPILLIPVEFHSPTKLRPNRNFIGFDGQRKLRHKYLDVEQS